MKEYVTEKVTVDETGKEVREFGPNIQAIDRKDAGKLAKALGLEVVGPVVASADTLPEALTLLNLLEEGENN